MNKNQSSIENIARTFRSSCFIVDLRYFLLR